MFYSQCLLSRKGPLGAVLIAAYCHNRLKKSQVINTDIPFSIKKIMDEGFPTFTYRILGYLLLGVVRIYSHKVEYVLLDCNQMLLKAKQAVAAKRKKAHGSSFLAPHQSITLPESLDLDKFIFEDIGVEHRDHLLPKEEIMLKDLWEKEGPPDFPPNGIFGEGVSIDLETFLDAGTPNYDAFPQPQDQADMPLDDTLTSDMDNIERGIETLGQKIGSTVATCDAEMVDLQAHMTSSPIIFDVNNEKNEVQSSKQVEAETSEGERELAKKLHVTVERSPDRNPSVGADMRQCKPMPTPTAKEKVPGKRKRTCLIDEQIVLSNKMVKDSIDYSGDLVSKRGRVPQTALGVWKYGLLSDLKKNFNHPLIRCVLHDSNLYLYNAKTKLSSAESRHNLGASKVLEIPVSPDDKNTNTDTDMIDRAEVPVVEKDGDHIAIALEELVVEKDENHIATAPEEPVEKNGDHISTVPEEPVVEKDGDNIAIAPETPHQDTRVKGYPLAEAFERMREGSSSNATEGEFDMDNYEEMPTEVNNSSTVDLQEPDGWSASTRQAVKDLSSAFKNGQREKEQVNLDEALRGKSKRTSARMFYDILVLKCRGLVNIQQDRPYGDILVSKSTTWETNIHAE